uniref:Uncharacterized protein n=1 Tax=Tanacetum cinerariifolium TaxID=118510 RepID=A0A6L2MTN7_TANCI|nr:hypothetical protein [Tanacetum cinerariifolium]
MYYKVVDKEEEDIILIDVHKNGNAPLITYVVEGVETTIAPATVEEKAQRRAPRSQDTKHKESTRRSVPVETPTSAALVSCDGLGGYDWSNQAEDGPTNFSLMAYSSTSSNSNVSTDSNCLSSCLENSKILKEQNEQLLKDLRTSKINDITYKTGLESVEARLLVYKKNKSIYKEDIKLLKREIHLREVAITELRRKLELAQKQKDEIQLTVENFENSSKNLSKLLNCLYEVVNESIVSEPTAKKPTVETSEAKASENKPKESSQDCGFKPLSDDGNKVDEDPRQESKCKDQEKKENINSIKIVNAASTNEVNDVSEKTNNKLPFDSKMPALEDISTFNFSSDQEDAYKEADMNNMDTTIQVSPTPTTRIHKDHPLDQVIGDLHSTTQIRNMSKNLEDHGFVTTIHQRTNHKDLQNYLFAFFIIRTKKGNPCTKRSKLDRSYAGRASTIQITRSLDFGGFTIWKNSYWY